MAVPVVTWRFPSPPQRALRLRRCPVDLVGEQELREHRPLAEAKTLADTPVDRNADDVRRQHVAGELHPRIMQAKQARKQVGQRGLADPRHVLDQQMAACQDAGQRQPQLRALAQDHRIGGLEHGGQRVG